MTTHKLPVIKITDDQKTWLNEESAATGQTMSAIVRQLIEQARKKGRKQ